MKEKWGNNEHYTPCFANELKGEISQRVLKMDRGGFLLEASKKNSGIWRMYL